MGSIYYTICPMINVRLGEKHVLQMKDLQNNADGYTELVASYKRTADLLGCNLGHVQNNDGRNKSYAATSNQTSNDHHCQASRCSLKDTSNTKDYTTSDNGPSTTDEVRNITSDNGSKKRASGEDRSGQRLVPGADDKVLRGRGVAWVRIRKMGVLSNEIRHGQDARHPTSIIPEEDPAECCKSAHEICLDCDRSFDTRRVGRAGDDYAPSHDEGRWSVVRMNEKQNVIRKGASQEDKNCAPSYTSYPR